MTTLTTTFDGRRKGKKMKIEENSVTEKKREKIFIYGTFPYYLKHARELKWK